jgi:hypothetical protein
MHVHGGHSVPVLFCLIIICRTGCLTSSFCWISILKWLIEWLLKAAGVLTLQNSSSSGTAAGNRWVHV